MIWKLSSVKLNFKIYLFYNYFYCVVIQAEVKTAYFKELRKMLCVFSNRNSPSRGKKTKNNKSADQIIKLFDNMTEKRLKTNKKKTREQEKEMRKIRFRTLFKNVQTVCDCFPQVSMF